MPDRAVSIDRVHPHGGTRRGFDQVAVGQLFQYDPGGVVLLFLESPADDPKAPGALALSWEVRGKHAAADGEKVEVKFVRDAEAARGLFRKFKIPVPAWPPSLGTTPPAGRRFVAAELPTAATLEFTFTLNTNHDLVAKAGAAATVLYQLRAERGEDDPQTQAALKEARAAITAACPPVTASMFLPQQRESYDYRGADGLGRVKVVPKPLYALPGYAGYVGIDLGNTGSMLAYMPHLHQGEIGLLRLESRQAGGAAAAARDAVPTAVWVKGYTPAPPPAEGAAAEMPRADWEIAWDAAVGPNDVLILGAKRLLSDPARDRDGQGYRVWLGRDVRIPKPLPAELFLTELVRMFHERVDDGPRQIAAPKREKWEGGPAGPTGGMAVTYPTTFSVREIKNLRRAAYSGWRRALGEARYDDTAAEMDRVITLLIDEASAAALYFIYRDFLSDAGRARWFRYLYPKGMNVLVYDCGGGTTDIALIRVHAEYRGGDDDSVSQLHIRVVGRTGHRGFGGDDITKAVFALVKAKTAAALPRGKGLALPTDPAALAAFLDKRANADRIDDILPTRFDRANLFDSDVRDRANAVLELWREAEWMKKQFTADPAGKVKPGLSGQGGGYVGRYYGARCQLRPEQVAVAVNRAEVSRAEVDAIIAARVAATVERANGLVRRRLGPERPGADPADIGSDVHKVYLLGNASRYPMIRQRLEEQAEVPFLAGDPDARADSLTRRLVFDEDNLKGAVAKGAVAALRMRQAFHGVEVFFDDTLTDRLPFHVSYADVGRGVQELFRESERYDALTPVVIGRPDFGDQPPGEGGQRTVFLQRQWPDDGRTEPYLTFEFKREIVGKLTVEYEPESGSRPPRFVMSDPDSGQRVEGVEVPEAEYVSPPQSGLL